MYRGKAQAAFTLLELAVIIAVVGLLTCLWAANLFRSSSQIKRAQCAANLKQFALALHMYGNDYEGRLPTGSGGNWAWDLNWNTGSLIERHAGTWKIMYCPGTDYTDADNQTLFNYQPTQFRVIGYAVTLSGNSLIASNVNTTLASPRIQIGFNQFATPDISERVLVADATISNVGQVNNSLKFSSTYTYTGIQGGFYKAHTSPHLSGRFPAGGNLAMLDGHVTWRKFLDMRARTEGNGPGFWW
jgi:prepilin-type processing-associated H-X9-DG protein